MLWIGIGLHAPVYADVAQLRRLDFGKQGGDLGGHFVAVADIGVAAAAVLGGFLHKVAVGCRADTHGEQAGVAKLALQVFKNLPLIAHAAIGDKHDLRGAFAVVGLLCHLGGQGKGGVDFGAAVGFQSIDKLLCALHVGFVGGHGGGKQGAGFAVEINDVKGVAGVKVA